MNNALFHALLLLSASLQGADDSADPVSRRAHYEARRPSIPAPLRSFYVDAERGDDAAAGTEQQPWRGLEKVNATLRPGDRFFLRGDFGPGQQLRPRVDGRPEAYIQFVRWPGTSERPLLRGTDTSLVPLMFGNRRHLYVEGLHLDSRGTGGQAIYLERASHIAFIDCEINSRSDGMFWLQTRSMWVEGCLFSECGGALDPKSGKRINGGDGIFIADGCSDNVIFANRFEKCGHGSVGFAGAPAYFKRKKNNAPDDPQLRNAVAFNDIENTWAACQGLGGDDGLFEHNVIRNIGTDPLSKALGREGILVLGRRNEVRYNLVYNTQHQGLQFMAFAHFNCIGNRVHHNTIFGCRGGSLGFWTSAEDVEIADNLVENNLIFDCSRGTGGPYYNQAGQTRYEVFLELNHANEAHYAKFRPDPLTFRLNGTRIRNNLIALTSDENPAFAFSDGSQASRHSARILTLEEFNEIAGGGNVQGPAPDFLSVDPASRDFLYLPKSSPLVGPDGRARYGIPTRVR